MQVDTKFGQVSISHNPVLSPASSRGIEIGNSISIALEMPRPIAFDDAISRTLQLLRFFGLVIGRPQNIQKLVLLVRKGDREAALRVHWSHRPVRAVNALEDSSYLLRPGTFLLNPIDRQDEFVRVMQAWLDKDEEHQDARMRFNTSFLCQKKYSVDRLISAANMFDILPPSAVPNDIEITESLKQAKQKCKEIFKSLPKSYERDSIFGALGRIGKASLKHKTRHRAKYLIEIIGEWLPDLVMVLEAAIDCRNHFVHGSPAKIDYNNNFKMVTFFTDTLEFVFGASELVEAGWDIQTFIQKPLFMTHPYDVYSVNYLDRLKAFKTLFSKERQLLAPTAKRYGGGF